MPAEPADADADVEAVTASAEALHLDDDAADAADDVPLDFVDEEAKEEGPAELPEYACSYCNVHTPAAVVKCCATGKWFCNYKPHGMPASCIVYHLIRSKHNEVMLHRESPLGEITLECFLSGAKNVFQLGSVPVKEDLVVLLARDVSIEKTEYDWDLSKWQPLIKEKEFVQWLVKKPSDAEALRSRPCFVHEVAIRPPHAPYSRADGMRGRVLKRSALAQVNKLEELWRTNPSATMADISVDVDADAEVEPTRTTYDDAYQYQNILGPLVKLEADYDRQMKEAQTQDGLGVRWDVGLNKKRVAYFSFPQVTMMSSRRGHGDGT